MPYTPKIITGKVTGTGLPIDGRVLYFSLWDYDPENWHLWGWEDADDEAVMQTMYQTEKEAGLSTCDTLEAFAEKWKAKQWTPDGVFALELSQVEVLEVKQEEIKDPAREKLRAAGIDLTPRKESDKGGILCLPLDKNLRGDTQAKHPDWEPVNCPVCSRKCWKPPMADKFKDDESVQFLCTECALEVGLATPYGQKKEEPKQGPNRAQRRRAKREQRRK